MRDDFAFPVKEALAKRVGYKCSNPNCRRPTSGPQKDATNTISIGAAAHIKAASPGGKRYDSNQTPEERKHINNGIWLCQNCAKLIDSDEARFTVEYVTKWKEMSEDAARLDIENPSWQNDRDSTVISINQTGGITAHTVNVNNKTSKRSFSKSASDIIHKLSNYPIAAYRLHYSTTNREEQKLAEELDHILLAANWQRIPPIQILGGPALPEGISIYMLDPPTEPLITLANQMHLALDGKGVQGQRIIDADNIFKMYGWPPVAIQAGRQGVVITIGPNPDN